MARKDEAERKLREGRYPSEIAKEMEISVASVIQYLRTKVGEGSLRLSDLYFSWPADKREVLQKAADRGYADHRTLVSEGLCREELELFRALRNDGMFRGDLYENLSAAEIAIHRLIRSRLEREYGLDETGWWRKGVPEKIRSECAARQELDEQPSDSKFDYTTLIDLSTIITKSWSLFQDEVPDTYRNDRKQLENDLRRLNSIRNTVMHPIKKRDWSEDEFMFVGRMRRLFETAVKLTPVLRA